LSSACFAKSSDDLAHGLRAVDQPVRVQHARPLRSAEGQGDPLLGGIVMKDHTDNEEDLRSARLLARAIWIIGDCQEENRRKQDFYIGQPVQELAEQIERCVKRIEERLFSGETTEQHPD